MKFQIKQQQEPPPIGEPELVLTFELVPNPPSGLPGVRVKINNQNVIDFVEKDGKLIARRFSGICASYIETETDAQGHKKVIKVSY
jgi:hypothetical protein